MLLASFAPSSAGLAAPWASSVTWPCNGVTQTVHDSQGQTNKYYEKVPGGAWNENAAAAAAAENDHQNVSCDTECSPPDGCVKAVGWTYDSIAYINGPDEYGSFIFTIKNFVVMGQCSPCP